MNMQTKKKLAFGLMLLGIGVLGIAKRVEAVGPNPDTMVVSVTPGNPEYGVYITSPSAGGYNFGPVNLGLTTGSTSAIFVKSSGTVSEYFVMSIVDNGASPWTALVADGTPAHDEFELLGRFNTGQPVDSTFHTTNDIVSATPPGNGTGLYNQGAATSPGTTRNLWLKLKMPASTTSPAARNFVLAISGLPS